MEQCFTGRSVELSRKEAAEHGYAVLAVRILSFKQSSFAMTVLLCSSQKNPRPKNIL
jgi:hypothetical protein